MTIRSGFYGFRNVICQTSARQPSVMRGERAEGIEPSCVAWKATVLPLNYARMPNRAMLSDLSTKCNSELPRRAGAAHGSWPTYELYRPPQELPCAALIPSFLHSCLQSSGIAGQLGVTDAPHRHVRHAAFY